VAMIRFSMCFLPVDNDDNQRYIGRP